MKYYYDLHLHSCLSPCGDDDMTPANIAGMAAVIGLDVIAVTDHNSCKNCGAVMKAAENICVHIDDFSKLNDDDTKLLISSIVKNTAIDIYRRNKNFSLQSTDEYIFSEDDATTTVEDELPDLFAEFDFGLLQKYVVKLKEKYKIVLIMRYKENLSNQAISRRLNLPVSTIGTHLERAKKELRKIIEEAQNDKPE